MSEIPPVDNPGLMSVINLIPSIQCVMVGAPTPTPAAAAVDLQVTQLVYDEDLFPGPCP
jgi:hypothetical protein